MQSTVIEMEIKKHTHKNSKVVGDDENESVANRKKRQNPYSFWKL